MVLGVSADDKESHQKFAKKYKIPFTLLCDPDRKVIGELEPCGLRPTFESKFRKHGLELPTDLFGPRLAEALAR